jgi:hypothetical protein
MISYELKSSLIIGYQRRHLILNSEVISDYHKHYVVARDGPMGGLAGAMVPSQIWN